MGWTQHKSQKYYPCHPAGYYLRQRGRQMKKWTNSITKWIGRLYRDIQKLGRNGDIWRELVKCSAAYWLYDPTRWYDYCCCWWWWSQLRIDSTAPQGDRTAAAATDDDDLRHASTLRPHTVIVLLLMMMVSVAYRPTTPHGDRTATAVDDNLRLFWYSSLSFAITWLFFFLIQILWLHEPFTLLHRFCFI